jgi:hypothetical protein
MSFKRDENMSFIPTANFKMPKQVKRTLATITDKGLRDDWRRSMAQSVMQSYETIVKKEKPRTKGSSEKV